MERRLLGGINRKYNPKLSYGKKGSRLTLARKYFNNKHDDWQAADVQKFSF